MNEATAIAIICSILGGDAEEMYRYTIDEGSFGVRVDCVTDTHAIEIGLDKRSSLDSVQQAEFAGWITGKAPMVIMVDRDGAEGAIEYRVRTTATRFNVEYLAYSDDFLLRWQMTSYLRERRLE